MAQEGCGARACVVSVGVSARVESHGMLIRRVFDGNKILKNMFMYAVVIHVLIFFRYNYWFMQA